MQVTDEMVRVAAEAMKRQRRNEIETGLCRATYEDLAKLAITAALGAMWRPISELSEEENYNRILVTGWQNPSGRVQGYWWWHEDVVIDGAPMEHPNAKFWCLAHLYLPSPPAQEEG